MKKTILLLSATLFLLTNINAQTATPAVKVFSNFNYDMSTEEGENLTKLVIYMVKYAI
tara:strand:- start:140 stop:313 length:174 start_codon:yes stop_codon:yes gene_type:complete